MARIEKEITNDFVPIVYILLRTGILDTATVIRYLLTAPRVRVPRFLHIALTVTKTTSFTSLGYPNDRSFAREMILDEVNKSRQMMLKNTSAMSNRGNREPLAAQCTDQRSLNLFTMVETQNYPTHFVPINSNFGNPLIAVFPRIATEEVEKSTTK
ncbi:hypothetical protein RB195_020421 [Necator americanus]|uniref:Uncharacterized protein n=2 Tax=Necator americanus TaxID=51031 RepID=A0ABR1CIR5_NECAM